MNQKGNQKHLTYEQRVDIEKGLTENKSFAEIGRIIDKDPSTISKEVRLHARTKERLDSGYTNPPCAHRKECKIVCLCDEQCGTLCRVCCALQRTDAKTVGNSKTSITSSTIITN